MQWFPAIHFSELMIKMLVSSLAGGKQMLERCSMAPASKMFPTQVIPVWREHFLPLQ